MNRKNKIVRVIIKSGKLLCIVTVITAIGFLPMAEAASGHRRPRLHSDRQKAAVKSSRGFRPVQVGSSKYYSRGGRFFRRSPSGFIAVRAPLGAFFMRLPLGARAMVMGGLTYYAFSGNYYRRVPRGYIIAKPPLARKTVKRVPSKISSQKNINETVHVTALRLNVRTGPGRDFPVIDEVQKGSVLAVHGYAPEWLYVELPGNTFGWIMLEYTDTITFPASG